MNIINQYIVEWICNMETNLDDHMLHILGNIWDEEDN